MKKRIKGMALLFLAAALLFGQSYPTSADDDTAAEGQKEAGTAEFTQPDWYVGEEPAQPVITSGTNGTGDVDYYYKKRDEGDAAYTETIPTEAGDYTAEAVFPATDKYSEVVKRCDFSISYLPSEGLYTIHGEKGANGWYTGEVTVSAAEGYAVRKSTDEPDHWMGSISFDQSQDNAVIYLRSTHTGALSDAVSLGNFQIDTKEPAIQGVLDGETYYEDRITVEIADENLSEVTVNGQQMEFSDGKAAFTLPASAEKYHITAKDSAGNTTEAVVAVFGNRLGDRINFTGVRLLSKGKAYELGHGNWQVAGDSTVYAGETSFYVEEDGEFYFSQLWY